MRAGDQLEVACHLAVGAIGQKALFLDRLEQHRLLVGAEFADFVEEQQAAVGRAQQAGARRLRAGECSLHMAEQCGHRRIAAQRRAVHLDEAPTDLVPAVLELVDAPREKRLARAGGADQQHRCLRAHRHLLDTLDQVVEARVARCDTRLEEGHRIGVFAPEALGDRS